MKVGEKIEFSYTGNPQEFIVPANGIYKLEVWGASGKDVPSQGYGGKGGYSNGVILLNKNSTLHIYVGESPTSNIGGWNGGGKGASSYGGGGGATDIRLVGGAWSNAKGLKSRIIVAGGGGGVGTNHGSAISENGGFGGGDIGGQGECSYYNSSELAQYSGYGGTQTAGGKIGSDSRCTGVGEFGKGGSNTSYNGSGGGGGWYGGGAGCYEPAGGGSGYVLTDSSHKPSGYTPTSDYWMTDTQLLAGNKTMPSTTGTGTQTGNTGDGFARITLIELFNTVDIKCSINGQVKEAELVSVKVNNNWNEVESIFVKIGNEWKTNV